jgi:hypothetical protein
MRSCRRLAIVAAMALAMASAGAATASATQIGPASTAFVLTSTNSSLAVSGGGTASCTNSTISGTTPAAGAATWKTTSVTLAYTGCTAFLFPATVTVPAACSDTITLHTMFNSSTDIANVVTIPSGCGITLHVPAISCTVFIAGPQTIGNGTSGSGGISWTNGSSTVKSSATTNNAVVPSVFSSGGGFGCPTIGAHTGTLSGTYSVTTPATFPGIAIVA